MKDLLTHELFTEKFAAYIVPKHMYVGKVVDPRTYDAISQDMANRWLYPIVLETNLLSPALQTSYQCSRNNMYKEDNIMIPYQCKITLPCIIG